MRWLTLILVCVVALALLRLRAERAAGIPPKHLRVGLLLNLGHAPGLVGLQRGEFQRALGREIEVREHVFHAGNDLVTALAAGELDLAYLGPGPALIAQAAEIRVVPVAGSSYGGTVLLKRGDAPIHDLRDLHRRYVGVPRLGNTQDILLRRVLRSHGLRDSARGGSVEVMQVEHPDMLLMFRRRQLDAAMVAEPWASRLELEAGAEPLLEWRQVWMEGRYPTALVVASERYAQAYPDRLSVWQRTHSGITAWLEADPDAAARAYNEAFRHHSGKALSDGVLHRALRRVHFDSRIDMAAMQAFSRVMRHLHYLRRPLSFESWWSSPWVSSSPA